MLKTTVYSDGVLCIGHYYDSRGIKTTVDYAGDSGGYNALMDELRLGDNDVTEVTIQSVELTAWFNVPVQVNPLMTVWNMPV